MTIRPPLAVLGLGACLVMSGCGLPPPGSAQRHAATFDSKSGSDPAAPSPRGFVASMPPSDLSADPLRCRNLGPDTVCSRDR